MTIKVRSGGGGGAGGGGDDDGGGDDPEVMSQQTSRGITTTHTAEMQHLQKRKMSQR
jgi:hypothetical protein